MELRHLRYFVAVAETLHFGQAAAMLHLAQPALSYAIRQLEAELDVTLFTRTTRQVSLTPAGRFLQGEAQRILADVDTAVDGVRRIAAGRSGMVSVGLTGIAAFSHLPRIARAVKSALPDVELRVVSDMLTPMQCGALQSGELDLGLLRPPVVGEGITVRTIDVEPMALVVADDHRLATQPEVATADLRNEPFVMYDSRDSAVNEAAVRACRQAGFAPQRAHDASGTAVLLALVAAGIGIAVLPASVRSLPLAGLTIRDLPDAGSIEVALAWPSGEMNPVTEAVIRVIEAEFATATLAGYATEPGLELSTARGSLPRPRGEDL